MIRRQHVVHDFFEDAEALRGTLDARFEDPYTDSINWSYFCDPKMYTYLRTPARKVFSKPLFERFVGRMRSWCMENLGLVPVGVPYLHLMVNGCRLGLHSDFQNGVWGYVYSLTRWDRRKFMGGETLLLRDGIPSYKKHHVHGEVLYELVPANFNQLLVFDDRIVHATPAIEGSMDPMDGRIAMVGHVRATAPVVTGSIRWDDACRKIMQAVSHLREEIKCHKDIQGTITYRLEVGASGSVESMQTLTDNLIVPRAGYADVEDVSRLKVVLQSIFTSIQFPATAGKSSIVVPVLIPIPDLRRVEFSASHHSSREAISSWAAMSLRTIDDVELQGEWEGDTYFMREPFAGSIRIERDRIEGSFDPPMWVASQRASFEVALAEWVKSASGAPKV